MSAAAGPAADVSPTPTKARPRRKATAALAPAGPDFSAIRRMLKEAHALGVRMRLAGAGVLLHGLDILPAELRERLEAARPRLWERLGGPGLDEPALALAAELGVAVHLSNTVPEAREAIRQLTRDKKQHGGVVGLDVETAPKPGMGAPLPWARFNTDGGVAARQPKVADKAGLSPHLADIQVLQLHAGGDTCFLFRGAALHFITHSHWLRRQHLVAHNAGFEAAFLKEAAKGYQPAPGRHARFRLDCTMQAGGLILGIGHGGERRSLANVASSILGLTVPKDLQVSDWAAPVLSPGQIAYAASDAIIARRLHPRLQQALNQTRRAEAYELQRCVIPAVAAMELRGLGFDREEHRRQSSAWSVELEKARANYTELTGRPPPVTPRETGAWLESVLDAEQLAEWPRTEETGQLVTGSDYLKQLAHLVPSCRPVLRMMALAKLLNGFGPKLAAMINPATGRLHAHYSIGGTKSGRAACSQPNLQQLPSKKAPAFRQCIVADAGNVLIGCDWNQIEMRAAAWLSGDVALTRLYAEGQDIHRTMAARINGITPDKVTKEQRQDAKPVSFGALFGQQAPGLVEYAFTAFDVELTHAEADAALKRFASEYPRLEQWKWDNYDTCQRLGMVRIGAGRVVLAEWEPPDKHTGRRRIRFTQACNLPIQGIAADCMLRAIRLAHARLTTAGIRGGLVATVHDELLAEVHEDDANTAASILEGAMFDAFVATFPGAPTLGVVTPGRGMNWAEVKG